MVIDEKEEIVNRKTRQKRKKHSRKYTADMTYYILRAWENRH